MEYKSIGQSFKDVDVKAGIATGFLSSFDIVDTDDDLITKGSFTRTINEWGPNGKGRIKHLLDHDKTKAVGVFQLLEEQPFGLYYESKAGRHTLGRDFLFMAEDGIIKEHSIGYKILKQEKTATHNIITEIKLYEGSSLQTWGANEYTPFSGVKSYEELLDEFDRLIKALTHGSYTDETMIKFQERTTILQEYFKTTQPDASKGNAIVPDGRNEDQTAKGFNSEVFFQHFKTALTDGRGASSGAW